MMDILNKITETTNRQLQEKFNQKVQQAQEEIERYRAVVEEAIGLIRGNLMYKDTGRGSYHHYEIATEEMFFQDFMSDPKYDWERGIKFTDAKQGSDNYVYHGVFKVNGHNYYDMRYLLDKYAKDVEAERDRICSYNDRLGEMIRAFDELVRQRPTIERLIKEWHEMDTKEDTQNDQE